MAMPEKKNAFWAKAGLSDGPSRCVKVRRRRPPKAIHTDGAVAEFVTCAIDRDDRRQRGAGCRLEEAGGFSGTINLGFAVRNVSARGENNECPERGPTIQDFVQEEVGADRADGEPREIDRLQRGDFLHGKGPDMQAMGAHSEEPQKPHPHPTFSRWVLPNE